MCNKRSACFAFVIIFGLFFCVKWGIGSYLLNFFVIFYLIIMFIYIFAMMLLIEKIKAIKLNQKIVSDKSSSRSERSAYFEEILFNVDFERVIKAMIIPIFVADFKILVDFGIIPAALLFIIICFIIILLIKYIDLLFQFFIKLVEINEGINLYLENLFSIFALSSKERSCFAAVKGGSSCDCEAEAATPLARSSSLFNYSSGKRAQRKIIGNKSIKMNVRKMSQVATTQAATEVPLVDSIFTEKRFGSYSEFTEKLFSNNFITNEYLENNFNEYKDNENFIRFLRLIPLYMRNEINSIIKLFDLITKNNECKESILNYNKLLPESVLKNIVSKFIDNNKEIRNCLIELNVANHEIDKVVEVFNKKINFDRLIDNDIEQLDLFIEYWSELETLLVDGIELGEGHISQDKVIYKEIVYFIMFCLENNLSIVNISIKEKEEEAKRTKKTKKIDLLEAIYEYVLEQSKESKSKRVNTRKKKNKEVRIKPGEKNSSIKYFLKNMKLRLEEYIVENLIEKSVVDNEKLIESINLRRNEIEKQIALDLIMLKNNFYKAYDYLEFITSISKDITNKNIDGKINKFKEYVTDLLESSTHDEIFYLTKFLSVDRQEEIKGLEFNRIDNLNLNNYFYVHCREILDLKDVDNVKKQFLLENFILNYEKEFTLNLIKNINTDKANFKLIQRIYKHSTPNFINRINIILNNYMKKYKENKDDMSKEGENLSLALFLVIKGEELTNILFSKVIKLIAAYSDGITQTQLISDLAFEMIIIFKVNSSSSAIEGKSFSEKEIEIIRNVRTRIINGVISTDNKFTFGHLLYKLLLDEFNYIFKVVNTTENKETRTYVTINKEYINILSSSLFNPIKLPMICCPKLWSENEKGAYLLEQFNDLNKNNSLIRQNVYNKDNSIASDIQVNTVNYLNSIPFNINKNMLNLLLREWNNDKSSIFNNFNKLHPLTENIDEQNSKVKKEILSHNSKHFIYSNILNIAALLQDHVIYFPTYLDFRGRIYPISSYLTYQGNDLARSLLLFNKISVTSSSILEILDLMIVEDDTELKSNIKKSLNFSEIDYVKLYLANVYGYSKWSRNRKINWVNKVVKDFITLYDTNFDLFNETVLSKAKEPAQFLACFLEYKSYLNNKKHVIKIPILFDATCSGVQHLSALTTNDKLAKLTNLLALAEDEPADFYNFCIRSIKETIEKLPISESVFKEKLNMIDLNRKMLKTSIMTVPYNVTTIGIADKLAENFDKEWILIPKAKELASKNIIPNSVIDLVLLKKAAADQKNQLKPKKSSERIQNKSVKEAGLYIYHYKSNSEIIFTQSELNKLGKIVHETVLSIIPPFIELKEYFDQIIEILKVLKEPIYWYSPTKMKISMSNLIMRSKKVKTSILKNATPITILLPTDQYSYTDIKKGLMPNFIHSLDASNIHLLIKNIKQLDIKSLNLYTIHDCFATDAKNMAILELLVKKSFVDLYLSKNYLESVHNSFVNQIHAITTVFENEKGSYIIIKEGDMTKTMYLPILPDFKWSLNIQKITKEVLFNLYFIS
jgi:hypothetical protein